MFTVYAVRFACVVEVGAVKLLAWLGDGKELDRDTQVGKIPRSSPRSPPHILITRARVIVICDDEQPLRAETRCLCRKEVLDSPQEIIQQIRGFCWRQDVVEDCRVLYQRSECLDIFGSRNVEIGKEIGMGVRWRQVTVALLMFIYVFSAKEDNTHHVVRVTNDALLHQLIGALKGGGDRAVLFDLFGVGRRGRRRRKHGLADFDGEDNSIFGAFVGLNTMSVVHLQRDAFDYLYERFHRARPLLPPPLLDGNLGHLPLGSFPYPFSSSNVLPVLQW